MRVLATENSVKLITETGKHHLLVEPLTVAPIRLSGVVDIYQLGSGWAFDTGCGLMKALNPQHLIRSAKQAGATGVRIV